MREDTFGRIKRTIESLENSTFLKISYPLSGTEVELSGRCSPYKSHIKVSFSEIPCARGIVFENYKTSLSIGGDLQPCPCGHESIERGEVPAGIVSGLGDIATRYFGTYRLQTSGLVEVSILSQTLAGWEEDGTPSFVQHQYREVIYENEKWLLEEDPVSEASLHLNRNQTEGEMDRWIRGIKPGTLPPLVFLVEGDKGIRMGCQNLEAGKKYRLQLKK